MCSRPNKSVLICLLVISCGFAHPEIVAGEPQRRSEGGTLEVQVLTEAHTALDNQALVRVRNIEDTDERSATTHLGNQASISNLARGSYTVEVSAVGYRTATTRAEVRSSVQMVQVVLQRDDKKTASATPDLSGISRKGRQQCAKGIAALQAGRSKEAEKQFRKALKHAPDNAHVNYLLGITLVQAHRIPEAISFLERSIALDPSHAQALTALGGLRFEAKDYERAANLLERAIAANDRLWRPQLLLANVYLALEQYDRARAHAEAAENLSNHSAPYATLALGQALSGLALTPQALAEFESFLRQAPTSPDAPAVRNVIAEMERMPAVVQHVQPATITSDILSARASSLLVNVAPAWGPADVDSVTPPIARGTQCPAEQVLTGVTENVKDLVDSLDRFSAVRTQVHQELNAAGEPLGRQTRKTRYLAAIARHADGLEINEYSQDLSGLGPFTDGIWTHGMLGLALIFHPTLESNYAIVCEGLGQWAGQPAWLLHFRQKEDRPLRLQGFRVGTQETALALKGRAWIAASTLRILHIEADLVAPVQELELQSEHQSADYGPVSTKKKDLELWLPKDTQTYLQLGRRRYLFSDHFDDFVLFSIETGRSARERGSNDLSHH